MPYWGCTKCHHEWEGARDDTTCDWCGAPGEVLEALTPLEKMLSEMYVGEDTLNDED